MNKQDAIKSINCGIRVKHTSFTDDAWVTSRDGGVIYVTEDGVRASSVEFWKYRTDPSWNEGWEQCKLTREEQEYHAESLIKVAKWYKEGIHRNDDEFRKQVIGTGVDPKTTETILDAVKQLVRKQEA